MAFAALGIFFTLAPSLPRESGIPAHPTAAVIVGCVTEVVGLLAFIVGGVYLWSCFVDEVHEVRITERGVYQDSEGWPWGSVRCIRVLPPTAKGGIKIFVTVSVRGLPPQLSFPVEVPPPDSQQVLAELKEFLLANGYSNRIQWQQDIS